MIDIFYQKLILFFLLHYIKNTKERDLREEFFQKIKKNFIIRPGEEYPEYCSNIVRFTNFINLWYTIRSFNQNYILKLIRYFNINDYIISLFNFEMYIFILMNDQVKIRSVLLEYSDTFNHIIKSGYMKLSYNAYDYMFEIITSKKTYDMEIYDNEFIEEEKIEKIIFVNQKESKVINKKWRVRNCGQYNWPENTQLCCSDDTFYAFDLDTLKQPDNEGFNC